MTPIRPRGRPLRKLILTGATLAALTVPAMALDLGHWADGVPWTYAFPENEKFGALAPRYAAGAVAGTAALNSPEALIQDWNRLPNDLHQQDCGKDTFGQPRRCLDMTFLGSGEYAGQSVTAHFDTLAGLWHFVGFDVR
jgi:hypothetical protein